MDTVKEKRPPKNRAQKDKVRERYIFAPTGLDIPKSAVNAGYIGRVFVAYIGALGMVSFIADALNTYETYPDISFLFLALVCLAGTAVFALAALNRITLAVFGGGALVAGGVYIAAQPAPLDFCRMVGIGFYNHIIDRLTTVGYTTVGMYRFDDSALPFSADASYPASYVSIAFAVLCVMFAALFVFTIARRVRLVPLVIVCVLFISSIFMYNITRTNTGFALILSALAGVIVLKVYDACYIGGVARTRVRERALEKKRAKLAAAEAKKSPARKKVTTAAEAEGGKASAGARNARPKRGKEESFVSVRDISSVLTTELREEEKIAYTPRPKPRPEIVTLPNGKTKKVKPKTEPMTPSEFVTMLRWRIENAGSPEAVAERAERKRTNRCSAAGGFAGFAATALALIVIWLPAATTKSYFKPVDFLNEKISIARMYVTAYLLGDDVDLNNLSLYSGLSDFSARDVNFDSPTYYGTKIMTVDTSYDTPVYLRSWIGTSFNYDEGKWYSAENDEIIKYRKTFGTGFSPEKITQNFYAATLPAAVDINRYDTYKNYVQYGFFIMQLNLTRINGNGYLLYIPSFLSTDAGILEYNSKESAKFKNTCYYDGIYTSRLFMPGEQYSTLSYVTSMRYDGIGDNITKNIYYYDYSNVYLTQLDYMLGQYPLYDVKVSEDGEEQVLSPVFENFLTDYENRLQLLGIQWKGDSILRRYVQMDEKERKAYKAAITLEAKYRDKQVKGTYVSTTKSPEIRRLAAELCGVDFDENPADLKVKYDSLTSPFTALEKLAAANAQKLEDADGDGSVFGVDFMPADGEGTAVPSETIHETVMSVLKYLENNYTYTLEPTAPATEDESDAVNNLNAFLYDAKEGYCVHFATAAAVLLREMGIPTRFCQGYLASDFWRNYAIDAPTRYRINVYDYNAHAWIEVYYPSLGWVQYEATPPFMSDMYDALETSSSAYTPTLRDPLTSTPEPEETDIDIGNLDAERAAFIRAVVLWSLLGAVVLALIVTAAAFVASIRKRSERAYSERNRTIQEAKSEADFVYGDERSRSLAKRLNDYVMAIFEALGVPPETGELPSQYAERLSEEYNNLSKYPITEVMSIIEKEEFGSGLNFRELYTIADYVNDITHSIWSGLSSREKFKMRYFKRVL